MIEKAKQYAESCRGDWKALADKAEVSYPWLCKFMQGQIPDPSYFRVQRIYNLAVQAERESRRLHRKPKTKTKNTH